MTSTVEQTRPRTHLPFPQSTQPSSRNHLPSLDGLRAFSILLVIICHGAGVCGHQSDLTDYWGYLGVSIFFVISGTLITWLLIREEEETGSVSLRSFYIRRALRILPVFWLFILCVIMLKSIHAVTISSMDILRAFTFTHNYPFRGHEDYAWWLHHTWSLSLEEQFYLVWPGLFALLAKRKSVYLAMIMALSGPTLRVANYYLLPSLRGQEWQMFHTRIDVLMMGCLAAFLLDSPSWRKRIQNVPANPVLLASSIFLLGIEPYVVGHYTGHTLARAAFSMTVPTIEAGVIAFAILILVAGKASMASTVFNQPAVMHVGRISYGMYLWQQFFLYPSSVSSLRSLLWRVPAIYLASLCSFNFLEKPFLNLRRKFRRVPAG